MKKQNQKCFTFLILIDVLLLLVILLSIILIIASNKSSAEHWTTTFSRTALYISGNLTGLVGFSIFEFIVIFGIVSIIVLIAWAIFHFVCRDVWSGVNKLMIIAIGAMTITVSYNAVVGPTYKRKALPLNKYKGEVKREELKEIATYFVEDWNRCADQLSFDEKGEIILPYFKKELNERIKNEYKKLDNNKYFNRYTSSAKPLFLSTFFTWNGVVGIFFGPTGEAHYNSYSTNAELPFYMAHEMAHSKGVMREDDAQLVATYICLNSEDPLLRFSVYYNTIDSIIDLTYLTGNKEDHKEVNKLIGDKVRANSKYIYYHWKGKYILADLGDKINDWYLKTFGQKEGTTSYQDTKPSVSPVDNKIYLSNYQNIYFNNYYKNSSF